MNKDLTEAIKILKKSKAIVYPTDTAYGLGVDALNTKAVELMYKIKQRKNQPTHIAVSSLAMAKQYVSVSKTAEKIFKHFLPGPLTIILPIKENVLEGIKMLSAGTGTLGIRIPDNKTTLSIIRKLASPVTTPSANPKGGATPYSIEESKTQFKNKKYKPSLYLDEGKLKKTKPSTLIKVEGNKIEVLRKGPISKKAILNISNMKV